MKSSERNKCKKYIMITFALILMAIFVSPLTSYAWWWNNDDSVEVVEFLRNHSFWLREADFFSVVLNGLGWGIIRILYWVASGLEGILSQSFNLMRFVNESGLNDLTRGIINGLVVALMTLTIAWIGLKTILGNPPNFKSVGMNIFISTALIVGMPMLLDELGRMSRSFYDEVQSTELDGSHGLAWSIIRDNTVDLVYVAQNGFDRIHNDATGSETRNALRPEMLGVINFTEVLTPQAILDIEGETVEELDRLRFRLTQNESGEWTAIEFENGGIFSFFGADAFDSGYFRYPMNFWTIFFSLLAIIIAYIFTLFVFITTFIEIGFKQVLSPFIFATDIETGQRTKQVVHDIMNAFLLIAFTGLSFRVYTMFTAFLGRTVLTNNDLAGVTTAGILYVVGLIAATFVLIKGSSTIMRYFGIDVGLNDGVAETSAAIGLSKGAFGAAKFLSGRRDRVPKSNKQNQGDSPLQEQEAGANPLESNAIPRASSNTTNGLTKSVNSASKKLGYMKGRGLSGMAEDAIKGTGEQIASTVKGTMSSATEGWKEGTELGQGNEAKWDANKNKKSNSISDDLASEVKKGLNAKTVSGILAQDVMNGVKNGNLSNDMGQDILQNVQNGKLSNAAAQNMLQNVREGKLDGETAQEIMQNIKADKLSGATVQDMMQNIKEGKIDGEAAHEVTQNIKTGKLNETTVQDMMQNVKEGKMDGQAIQEVVKNVKEGKISEAVVQEVMQSVKSGNVSGVVAQEVLQDIKEGKISEPVVQGVMQNVRTGNISESVAQEVIQNVKDGKVSAPVIQEVMQSVKTGNVSGAAAQEIIQDVKEGKVSGPVVQGVVQNVRKGNISGTVAQEVLQDVKEGNISGPVVQEVMRNVKTRGMKGAVAQEIFQDVREGKVSETEVSKVIKKNVKKRKSSYEVIKEKFNPND